MNNKVFLGGTCNNSTWRDELIPQLKIDYFNPVVEDWTEECQEIEKDEKENKCDIHLYVITNEMTGVFSIAEAVDSVHNDKKFTIFYVIKEGFDKHQLKSIQAVAALIDSREGYTFIGDELDALVSFLNGNFE